MGGGPVGILTTQTHHFILMCCSFRVIFIQISNIEKKKKLTGGESVCVCDCVCVYTPGCAHGKREGGQNNRNIIKVALFPVLGSCLRVVYDCI